MVDLVIPETVQEQWKALLNGYEEILGHQLVICATINHSLYQPIVSSSGSTDYVKHALDIDAFIKSVLANDGPLTRQDVIADVNYVTGFPISWASKASFGALMVLCKNQGVSTGNFVFLESMVSHIEKDLRELYKNHQQKFESQLSAMIHSYPTPEFQNFIDSFEDHIWIKNLDGVYIHGNREIEKAWSRPLSEIIGKTDEELFEKEIADKFAVADKQALCAGKQSVVEECANALAPHGKTWLETVKTPLVNSDGELTGIIGMTRNVTNRKAIEDQLLVAATVFENSVEGVIITNTDGMIIYVNKAFCEITGFSEIEAIGRNPRFMKSGRHEKWFYKSIWAELLSKGKWKGEIWNRRKNGEIFPELLTISVVYDEKQNICNYVGVFADISHQKQQEHDLQHMAYHDPLTDLPNRTKLSSQIEYEISHAKRQGDHFATIFIDVDHFKHINDSYGHLIGDEVLCEVAARLKNTVREVDTVSRIGGDEFVLLLPGIIDLDSIAVVVQKIMSIFDKPIQLGTIEPFRLTGSMGIALYPHDGEDSELLLSNADAAMYRAKQTGRNNYAYYTEALTKESDVHIKLQAALHDALEFERFYLVYQPQVDMVTGKLTGFEALLRWFDPKLGLVLPEDFIPIAEKTGLIQTIGLRVVKEACQQAVQWRDKGYDFGRVAVNVAGAQLQRTNFAAQVIAILEDTGLQAKYLELEITEGFLMSDAEDAIKQLRKLRAYGIELSMDDFGTGYSSLSYLQKLPLNKLKIDRSFIVNLPENIHDIAITDTIIALGNAMSLKIIAEGVETFEQSEFLIERGCLQAQGYYFSKPLLPDELIPLLEQQNSSLK